MPSNPSSLIERCSEIRAQAEAAMVVKILGELASEPSTKRFVKSSGERIARWDQLATCAAIQVNGLHGLTTKPIVRKTKAKAPTPAAPASETPVMES